MIKFEVKEEHIKLLKNARLEWSNIETSAPAIDPKRPYGNSFVVGDVAEILGIELGNEEYENKFYELMQFHYDTLTVLEIVISTGVLESGLYCKEEVGSEWKKVM
jgi:hypothetical protein